MSKYVVLSVLWVGLVLTSCGQKSKQEGVTLQGAGATFPAPLYATWNEAYKKANPSVKVDYQANGSGAGIKAITERTVQFAGSDAPMTDEQMKAAPGALHIPMVSGPVVMIYNLASVKELKLNGSVIADMYLGNIKKWNDPKIAALNPGVTFPDKDITPAYRSDGSGTNWIFTNYMCKVSEEFKTKIGNGTSVKFTTGMGGAKSDGLAAAVKGVEGGIGYAELAYAEKAGLPYAIQINKAGKAVKASIDGVVAASKNSNEFPEDMRLSITDAAGDDSYPIAGYTYILVYQDLSYLKKEQAIAVVNLLNWYVTEGQATAKPNYAPLAEEVQKKAVAQLKKIVFDGAALLK